MRYEEEQPVVDNERQLARKLVDGDVMDALQQSGYMTPQHMMLIDNILMAPGATFEAELQRQIAAIRTVIEFCPVEEGLPTQHSPSHKRPVNNDTHSSLAKRQNYQQEDETILYHAIAVVRVSTPEERPQICFLCVGDCRLSIKQRARNFSTVGSLTRHIENMHIKPPWPNEKVMCKVCNEELGSKVHLLNHAESRHGTVSRRRL